MSEPVEPCRICNLKVLGYQSQIDALAKLSPEAKSRLPDLMERLDSLLQARDWWYSRSVDPAHLDRQLKT